MLSGVTKQALLLSVCLPMNLSAVFLFFTSVYLSIYLYLYLFLHLSTLIIKISGYLPLYLFRAQLLVSHCLPMEAS